MTAKTRLQLAAIFQNSAVPTASGFSDLFDSFVNLQDTVTDPQIVQSGLTVNGTFRASGGAQFGAGQTVTFNGPLTANGPVAITSTAAFSKQATFAGSVIFASAVQYPVDASISAAGSAQGAAFTLTAFHNVVKSGALNQGVIATPARVGQSWRVYNRLGVRIFLYPAVGASIDGLSANIPCTISASTVAELSYVSATEAYLFRGVAQA